MTTKLFKTRKLAEKYISENYTEYDTEEGVIDERSDWEAVDMPGFEWQGETSAISVIGDDSEEIDCVAWWEEGDDKYELFVGGKIVGTFDNNYDSRKAYNDAVDEEICEDKPREVKLFCNGEDISN